MITANKLQNSYNFLYENMRNYIWDFETVTALADLEVATYQRFPDIDSVGNKLAVLKKRTASSDAYKEDDELKNAFDEFESSINDADNLYASIKTFKEVIPV